MAVSEDNGYRYLFFQDPTGLIRGAVRTEDQWSTSLNLGISSNAKDNTPLAATTSTSEASGFGVPIELSKAYVFCKLSFTQISLYYVSEGNVLNSSSFYSGFWSPDTSLGSLSLGNFSTAVNTRSLSAANIGNATMTERSLLLYEDSNGIVSALCLVFDEVPGNDFDAWVDITSQESKSLLDIFHNTPALTAEGYSKTLSESLGTNSSTLSAPFTCQGTNRSQQSDIEAIFYSPNALNFGFQSSSYSTGPSSSGNFSRSIHFVFSHPVLMFIS